MTFLHVREPSVHISKPTHPELSIPFRQELFRFVPKVRMSMSGEYVHADMHICRYFVAADSVRMYRATRNEWYRRSKSE